jgi:FMN phosphatase YigB (HAD superfamily)
VLKTLKAHNYTLGVISDWGIGLGPILRRLQLTGYFDCLLVSAVTRHAKPSPALYELALQRANSIADYTIHIGDSYIHDVLGARTVGITPILLDRHSRLEENNVDCLMVHSLHELLELLEVPEKDT